MKIKVFLFSSLMLLQLTNSYAQNEKQEKEFLNWFFREHQKLNGKVFYLAAIATDKLSYLRSAVHADTLYAEFPPEEGIQNYRKDTLVFSVTDRALLQREMKSLKSQNLPDQCFEGGKMLSTDSLKLYAKDNLDFWGNLAKNKMNSFWMFSRPIFLRDQTICVFNYSNYCGFKCAYGKTAVYEKRHGRWRRLMVLSSWIS